MQPPLLAIRHLSVSYPCSSGPVRAVRDVSIEIAPGEKLALVGETGCGKTTIAQSLLGLLDPKNQSGELLFEGRNLLQLGGEEWRRIRGRKISMIFQDARGALNPVLTIGAHLIESLLAHQNFSKRDAKTRALELLAEVGIPDPRLHMRRYSFELSGGMCQRVGIALGICNQPQLLVADEPTSALDPSIQGQILNLLKEMRERHNLALILISHDLAMVAEFVDRIAVMYHGRVVETGTTSEVFLHPGHPYTQALLECVPNLSHHKDRQPLISIQGAPPLASHELPGCAFAPRCPLAEGACLEDVPEPVLLSETHWAACIKARQDKA